MNTSGDIKEIRQTFVKYKDELLPAVSLYIEKNGGIETPPLIVGYKQVKKDLGIMQENRFRKLWKQLWKLNR